MTIGTLKQVSITHRFAELEQERKLRSSTPCLSNIRGTIYVALTTIMLAYGALLGFVSILVIYAIWLPKINYKGVFLLRPTREVIFVMLLPMLAMMSAVWSDYPADSLKSSMEYTSLIVCTVIIAKIVRIAAFIRGMIIGSTFALIVSLLSGQYGLDPFTNQYTLIGLFGSKNQIGLFAEIGMILSLLGLYVRQRILAKILFAFIPFAICLVSLYLSKSASSVLTLILTLAVVFAAAFIAKLPRAIRAFALLTLTVFALFATAVGTVYDAQDLVLKSFGKDTTLTGRTYLWVEGIEQGMEAPLIGHGYQAFWVVGRPKAEQLWQKFGITARVGFHFHDLFIETFVELGTLGVILLLAMMLTTCLKSIRLIIQHGMSVEYAYALVVAFMFLTRAIVEVDLIGTFSIGPILFFSVIPRLANVHREQKAGYGMITALPNTAA